MKIGLRGGHSPYCKGSMALRDEQECVRALCYEVKKVLEKYGHTVVDCNSNAYSQRQELQEGANEANNENVDYFISLHMNAFNGQAHGTEAWTYNQNSRANTIAKRLVDNFEKLGYYNRGVKYDHSYYEMRNINAPNIIFETLFCDNENDVELWAKGSWELYSYSIANAIDPNIPLSHENNETQIPPSSPSNNTDKQGWRVVVGYYEDYNNATKAMNVAKEKGLDSYLVPYSD